MYGPASLMYIPCWVRRCWTYVSRRVYWKSDTHPGYKHLVVVQLVVCGSDFLFLFFVFEGMNSSFCWGCILVRCPTKAFLFSKVFRSGHSGTGHCRGNQSEWKFCRCMANAPLFWKISVESQSSSSQPNGTHELWTFFRSVSRLFWVGKCLFTILMSAGKRMCNFRRRVAGFRMVITEKTSLEFHRPSWGIDTMVHPARGSVSTPPTYRHPQALYRRRLRS
jgi:hypothetical protein